MLQEYRDFELLVIDDGSTDGSSSALKDFIDVPNVRIIWQPNGGESAARNRGLAEMSGEVAVFLDADDEWLPPHLSDIATLVHKFPEAGIFAGRFAYVQGNEQRVEGAIRAEEPILIRNYFEIASQDLYILNSSSSAVRKRVVAEVGGFMEKTPYGADVEYWARIILQYPLAYHPRLSSLYHIALPDSAMAQSRWKLEEPPVVRTLKKYLRTKPAGVTDVNSRDVVDYAAWTILNLAASGIRYGHSRDARKLLADPILAESRFQRRLRALRSVAALPDALAQAVCQLHTIPWAPWQRIYRNLTRPAPISVTN